MKKLIVIFCMVLIISSCGKAGIHDDYVDLFRSGSYYLEFSIQNKERETTTSGFFAQRDDEYYMQLELSHENVIDILFEVDKVYFIDNDEKTYTISEDDPFNYEYIDGFTDFEVINKSSDGDDYVITCKNGHENTVYLNYIDGIPKSIEMVSWGNGENVRVVELEKISSSIPDGISFEIPKDYRTGTRFVPAMD